ncbi:hypothetical protein ACFO25_12690 [Paenactinomyces guangxiensis]|uniref:Uncharacterized protein n=1 Tax=Paenactinomyces guangxiensis TaxID=1490290 RepID=A0A7W1WR73_9BACL|nr:hypothetical protein [Paenactinomyces guangxiensis]MBA4494590.1 hypothetical protein [Paenactinomyces guangxiensis]MBH8591647.1 hypothetical protein [Paenactinomyces guangxiensis]
MSNHSDDKKPAWPKYLPYTPIAMGMIQPEWMYMSHFFEEDDEEEGDPAIASVPQVRPASARVQHEIQINFRPRSSPK